MSSCWQPGLDEVKHALPEALVKMGVWQDATLPLAEAKPLQIKERTADSVASYKECWNDANCECALRTSSVYEAGGSLFWLPASQVEAVVPCQMNTWSQIQQIESLFQEDEALERVIFPCTLNAWVQDVNILRTAPSKALALLDNHAIVIAWWWLMFEALRAEDNKQIRLLFEAGLTVTIRLRVGGSPTNLVVHLLQNVEKGHLKETTVADNLITFSEKFMKILQTCQAMTLIICRVGKHV